MQHADDVLAGALEHGQAAEGARGDDTQHIVRRGCGIHDRQAILGTMNACGAEAEPQRAMQADLLFRLEQPAVAALRDQQFDSWGEWTWRCPVAGSPINLSSSTPLPFRNAIDH